MTDPEVWKAAWKAFDDKRSNDPQLLRDIATLLYAADMMWFGEQGSVERQVAWCRSMLAMADNNPIWANGKHDGDCTKQPMTCMRCVLEEWEDKARTVLIGADSDWIKGTKA